MSRYQLFPALAPATEAALIASIQRFGVLVPVVKDQDGNLLDGHHRSRIADDLGVDYRVDRLIVADDDERQAIIATLNVDRGHRVSADMRRLVVADLREQGHSLRAIAGAVGVDVATVHRDLATVAPATVPDRAIGLDGKSRPAKRTTIVAAKSKREDARAQEALSVALPAPGRVVDVKRAERIAREQEAERRRQEPCEPQTIVGALDIRHGKFWEALADVPESTVDAIVTDPPYGMGDAGIRTLYVEAIRLLAPGGSLVCMIGQTDVLSYLAMYSDLARQEIYGLDFRWVCAWLTPGSATRMHSARVGTNWKPVMVFTRLDLEGWEETETEQRWLLGDVFRSPADDKEHHHWGQNLSGFRDLVEAFTQPGDLVLDPFLGGGTTAVACRDLGRRFIGCDVDPACISTTLERLA